MEIVIPSAASLGLFVSAALVLLIIPGPAVLYIIGRSIEQGPLAGVVSVLGITTATLVHVAAATLGLSAILASSALAFSVVKYAGAAYLIWLGLRKILSRTDASGVDVSRSRVSRGRLFREGFVVNCSIQRPHCSSSPSCRSSSRSIGATWPFRSPSSACSSPPSA